MSTPFSYSTTYRLDKSHFSETFDESVPADEVKTVYVKPFILALLGMAVLFLTEISGFAAWFIIALAALEFLSIRFRKPWWLARQMISKAANTELTLSIDESGVSSRSLHVESKILWDDVSKIEKTTQGWLLYHAAGKSYLSNRCLSEDAKAFINAQAVSTSR